MTSIIRYYPFDLTQDQKDDYREYRKTVLPPNSIEIGTVYNNLGSVYQDMGNFKKALVIGAEKMSGYQASDRKFKIMFYQAPPELDLNAEST